MSSLDDRLMPILVAHHGLVSRAHVLSAGGTDDEISGRLRAGRWERVAPGVYRLVGFPATWESLVLGGVLSAGPGARASHLTAAVLHDIPGFGRGTPEISVHRSRDRRRAQVRVHTSTDLERSSVVARYGIPTTDVNRTLLDIGRVVGDQRLHRAIEHCRRTGATDWSAVIGTLARHARRGRPGIRRLRRVISANAQRHEITDSDFELLVLALLAEAGLPAPELHHRVEADGRFVAEVDLAYRACGSPSSSMAPSTSRTRFGSGISPARTTWCSPVGRCCASPGVASATSQNDSSPRSELPLQPRSALSRRSAELVDVARHQDGRRPQAREGLHTRLATHRACGHRPPAGRRTSTSCGGSDLRQGLG